MLKPLKDSIQRDFAKGSVIGSMYRISAGPLWMWKGAFDNGESFCLRYMANWISMGIHERPQLAETDVFVVGYKDEPISLYDITIEEIIEFLEWELPVGYQDS